MPTHFWSRKKLTLFQFSIMKKTFTKLFSISTAALTGILMTELSDQQAT